MGFRYTLLRLNWPALVCGFLNVSSAFALILLSKVVFYSLDFPFPATLALLHTGGIALMLWFWTVFGMFKPRKTSLASSLRIAAPYALTAVLSLATLRHTSLSVFQSTRLAVAPATFALERVYVALQRRRNARRRRRNSFESSLIRLLYLAGSAVVAVVVLLVVMDTRSSAFGIAVAISSALATAFVQVRTLPHLRNASFTELQLQLHTKSCSAVMIAVACPFVDDYSPSSPNSIMNYTFPEHYTLLIIFTSLLAFLSFVSMRASASRSTTTYFAVQSTAIAACSFTADQYFFSAHEAMHNLWLACVVTLLLATLFFSFLRETQMRTEDRSPSGDHVVESSDEESLPVRSERQATLQVPLVPSPAETTIQGEVPAPQVISVHRNTCVGVARAVGPNATAASRHEAEVLSRQLQSAGRPPKV